MTGVDTAPRAVRIFEVGPRDGLQNEKQVIAPAAKIEFIRRLAAAGLRHIEATSFVRPGVIPQLSDAAQVFAGIRDISGPAFSVLVPNRKGMENALAAGAREVAVFTAASNGFTKKNINATIEESFERFAEVFQLARENKIAVRAYVSTVVECPYEGPVAPETVRDVSKRLLDLGAYEISLGETIGVAAPADVRRLLDVVARDIPAARLAGHFHDTRGTALANVMAALDYGVRTFDSSAGGLGGCPYAPGASGNLATEDLVYTLERCGYETGVDLEQLGEASNYMEGQLGRTLTSRVYAALKSRPRKTKLEV